VLSSFLKKPKQLCTAFATKDPAPDITAALEGEQPPLLRMPHYPSALEHEAEIDKAITDMIASDALRKVNDLCLNDTDLERY